MPHGASEKKEKVRKVFGGCLVEEKIEGTGGLGRRRGNGGVKRGGSGNGRRSVMNEV